jgi:hypothetical protein
MDLRDIQRLHAQFSPDTITIDLPRQIAALPAPTVFGSNAPSPGVRSRWTGAAPVARASIIAITAAALVGMAGMGAASLYKASRYAPVAVVPTTTIAPARHAVASNDDAPRLAKSVSKEIDATSPQPVDAAPHLSASDITTSSSLGLTADQFRSSLKTRELTNQPSGNSRSDTATASDIERAAASPIHRAAAPRAQEQGNVAAATQTTPIAPVVAVNTLPTPKPNAAETVVVQQVPQQLVSVSPAVASQASTQTAPVSQNEAPLAKTAHPVRRHISKTRSAQTEDAETATPTAVPAQSGPSAHTGSNEVQMF